MTNQQFSRHTRQTAFNLTLNNDAINEILFLDAIAQIAEQTNRLVYGIELGRQMHSYLSRRGLIEPSHDPSCHMNSILTPAGRAVATVLRHAGFSSFMDDSIKERVQQHKDMYAI